MIPSHVSSSPQKQPSIITIRFLIFGAINYIAGNLIFTAYWWRLSAIAPYWFVALVATITASVVSYSTHTFGTLRSRIFDKRNLLLYTCMQGVGLLVSSVLVPGVSRISHIHLLLVQYGWSGLFSIVGILTLRRLNARKGHS